MKKWMIWILTAAMCLAALAGCGTQSTAPAGTATEASSQTAAVTPSASAPATATSAQPTATATPEFNLTAQIEEQVIYDKDGVLIKAMSLGTDSYEDQGRTFVKLNIHAENTGKTKEVDPMLYNIAINGIMINTYQGTSLLPSSAVEPKHYKKDDFYVIGYIEDGKGYYSPLADVGITDIATIDFDLVLKDPNVNDDEIGLVKHVIDSVPVSIKTNIADSYTQAKPNPDGQVIYDQDGVRIVCIGAEEPYYDEDWCTVSLFMENNSTDTFAIHSLPTQINGTVLQSTGSTQLSPVEDFRPGTCAFVRMHILSNLMTANGVDTSDGLKSLACCFEIRQVDYYINDTLLSKTPEVSMTFE